MTVSEGWNGVIANVRSTGPEETPGGTIIVSGRPRFQYPAVSLAGNVNFVLIAKVVPLALTDAESSLCRELRPGPLRKAYELRIDELQQVHERVLHRHQARARAFQ